MSNKRFLDSGLETECSKWKKTFFSENYNIWTHRANIAYLELIIKVLEGVMIVKLLLKKILKDMKKPKTSNNFQSRKNSNIFCSSGSGNCSERRRNHMHELAFSYLNQIRWTTFE